MSRNITTIELKRETHNKLNSLRRMGHSFDDVVAALINDREEIQKYIQRYINGANGKCITKVILGHAVVANHHFDCDNICKKCGIQAPITINRTDDETIISVGHGDDNDINADNYSFIGDAIQSAKEKLPPNGGIVQLAKGEY